MCKIEGEEPASTLLRLKERLEFATGLRIDQERLFFTYKGAEPLSNDKEIVAHSTKDGVLIKVKPRPGYPQDGTCAHFDIAPRIARLLDQGMVLFPLEERFRTRTVIWGTSELVKKLSKANPNLMEEARSLGVEEVLNEILRYPIPITPGTELIPLELLESVGLVRGLLAYMNAHVLIKDNAGYDLTPKEK